MSLAVMTATMTAARTGAMTAAMTGGTTAGMLIATATVVTLGAMMIDGAAAGLHSISISKLKEIIVVLVSGSLRESIALTTAAR
jgi:ABC-type lipopolysaccharide export system ATPase subunit